MKISLNHKNQYFIADLSKPIDISISSGQVRCFYSTEFKTAPYRADDFIGSVKEGAPVNFYDVQINPHGNGTHTECLGHITEKHDQLNDCLKTFHFVADVVSVDLTELENGDFVIQKESLETALKNSSKEDHQNLEDAIIIRTLPNTSEKLTKDYSDTNPPYLEAEAVKYLVEKGVRHLLLDLPSVDREVDAGVLASHHVFWNVDGHKAIDDSRKDCTITELIFVPNEIEDGKYLLNIQVPSIPLDAVPSKPVIYKLTNGE